ncbi:nucleoside transporter-domain-containing protein [Mariannaea sp. PMI_226]|nr:nucleoside transporter-domain-containing protein [Mariannaea sp. PMI_226]
MDRIRRAFARRPSIASSEYEPLTGSEEPTALEGSAVLDGQHEVPFSWMEYSIFALLGMAMLWAWNMFLAAAPYFAARFADNDWILGNFQSTILAVSTVTNLGSMIILSNIQATASYPFRINLGLILNIIAFALLTVSTYSFLNASAVMYLVFLLIIVAGAAWAAALIQNGAFAFAASFGRPEYIQAIMAGQGVAGVLPSVAQVIIVLIFPPTEKKANSAEAEVGSSSAFVYFLTAVAVSLAAFLTFIPLVKRYNHIIENRMIEQMAESTQSIKDAERASRKVASMWTLFRKLRWLCTGVAIIFAATMFFPVFTTKIYSVREDGGPLFQPYAFIPLGFFFWNIGDLGGRMATMLPFSLNHRPFALFVLSVARVGMLPLYLLCNIGGRGAVVPSDFFYLFFVQLLFGFTNGWLGSSCMVASSEWVDEGEREASGGFMSMCLVAGLTCGSILSFTIADI